MGFYICYRPVTNLQYRGKNRRDPFGSDAFTYKKSFCTAQFCFMFFRYRGVQNETIREVDPLGLNDLGMADLMVRGSSFRYQG